MSADLTLHLNPVLAGWLIAVLAALMLAAVSWSAMILRRRQVPRRWLAILCALRIVAVALFVIGLLQPVISFNRTTHPKPALTVVIDTSASMAMADGDSTRLRRATAVLAAGPFADHLQKHFAVAWYSAGPSVAAIDGKKLEQLEANGETTRLADSLRTAVEQNRADGPGPRRVLLVSDGADHGSTDPAAAGAALGIPVDALPVGSGNSGSPAFSVVEVQASPRVLLGSETRFLAIARGEPSPTERSFTLHLTEDGREVSSMPLSVPAGRSEVRAELAHRPEAAGVKRYTLRLSSSDADSAEFPVNVQVQDRTYEVLILEDTWRWEFKYLRRSVEDDPSFRFTAVLARGPATVMQFGSPDRRAQLVGMPQNAADIAPFDLFMLGDVNPGRWPRGLAAEIARAVKEDGKSLVLIAGPNLSKLVEQPELHSLLPVELGPESGLPTEGDVEVRASDSMGARFFFEPSSESAALPPLDRVYAPVRKRPGARVLLEASRLANSFGPLIVMAEQTVGRGRVLFVGTDSLYLWQTLSAGDGETTPHRTYWQRALRALAPARPAGDTSLWLLPERTRMQAGQQLAVWAESRGAGSAAALSMSITPPDDKTVALACTPDAAHPGRWRASFTPPTPGTYRIASALRVEGQPAGEASTLIEVTPNEEMTDTAPDPDTLGRIAQASGGRIVNPADPATWPIADAIAVTRRVTLDFWGDGLLLVMLTMVLGLDWLFRLLRGYV